MKHITIIYRHSREELMRFINSYPSLGTVIGNDGYELIVTDEEWKTINSYLAEHPNELVVDEFVTTEKQCEEMLRDDWPYYPRPQ